MTMIGFAAQSYAAEPNKGMALYRGHCAACHGIDGGGNGPKAAGMTPPPTNFRNATVMHGLQDSQLERAILAGKPGTAMKGYGTIFNGQDVAALVKYLRSLPSTQ
jgi:mono/diheme cytochrome c family protein